MLVTMLGIVQLFAAGLGLGRNGYGGYLEGASKAAGFKFAQNLM